MLTDFKLPELGENIKGGTAVRIAVKSGASVTKGQTLIEIETDKASIDVPSPVSGVVKEILIKEGAAILVGQIVMTIDTGVAASAPATAQPLQPAKQEEKPAAFSAKPASTPAAPLSAAPTSAADQPAKPDKDVPAAPSVRAFAREIGIDISQVPGSGPSGRISMQDVKAFAKALDRKSTR